MADTILVITRERDAAIHDPGRGLRGEDLDQGVTKGGVQNSQRTFSRDGHGQEATRGVEVQRYRGQEKSSGEIAPHQGVTADPTRKNTSTRDTAGAVALLTLVDEVTTENSHKTDEPSYVVHEFSMLAVHISNLSKRRPRTTLNMVCSVFFYFLFSF